MALGYRGMTVSVMMESLGAAHKLGSSAAALLIMIETIMPLPGIDPRS
jgi:hypothetical protein